MKKVNLVYVAAFLLITFVFLFLRFWKIQDGLFFFNDMGRDLLVLQNWQSTGKPPLLGPQTSALPFNQSALYFYLLYPAFILTNQSPYTALITNAVLYLGMFSFLFFLFWRDKHYLSVLLVIFGLVAIHPQYVIQSRYVWNPSFVTPFLTLCFSAIYYLLKQYSRYWLAIFGLSAAIAVSLSYSTAPTIIVILLTLPFIFRRQSLLLYFSFLVSLLAINLPTVIFEMRHGFLLTHALLSQKSPPQANLSINIKIPDLSHYLISSPVPNINLILLFFLFLISLVVFIKSSNLFPKLIALLFIFSGILSLVLPISLQAHYIFGVLTSSFFLISLLSPKLFWPTILILASFFLNPRQLQTYFQPAPRSYNQLNSCLINFCQNAKDPLFVSVVSSYHPYHNGPEFRYLLKKNNCKVVDIESGSQQANLMALVVDGGNYSPSKTKFYELDLFGLSRVQTTFPCPPNLEVVLLQKTK
jgi:hypothetical protein